MMMSETKFRIVGGVVFFSLLAAFSFDLGSLIRKLLVEKSDLAQHAQHAQPAHLVKIHLLLREVKEKSELALARFESIGGRFLEDFEPKCPTNWNTVGQKCILFGNDFVNYGNAMASCKQNGGRLYEPRDRLEHTLVKKIARVKSPLNAHDHGPWIGINDIKKENEWRYTSTGEKVLFTDFAPTQPDNGGDERNEDCVHLWKKFDGPWKWNDIPCDRKLAYICEVPKAVRI